MWGGRLTLHTRISLLLTAVVASLMLVLGGLWLSNTRDSIVRKSRPPPVFANNG